MKNQLSQTRNKIYLGIIVVSAIAIIILGAGYIGDRKRADQAAAPSSVAMKGSSDKVLVSVSTEVIEDGLENMGVLITQEYYFTQVETYTKEKKILNLVPSTSELVYSYDGAVMAGIDFEQIKITKDEESKTLSVDIPHSIIQAVTIDKDSFKVFSEKDSLWNPMKLEDYNDSLSEFEEAAKEKALENGIIERSDEQARALVENFIGNFPSANGYEIRFVWRNNYEP
ncbi:DUF4230 domain-containing protein [Butyrivibrio sp. VCB2006]|uniref:DUF4230 domain-containing protein n=1 Tax=Butyrivibrio sp. VCB2006 TaxID=1280679 RepID=UPI00040E259D|nr:DUF4230 domain-containing protein [Butyrivibrio sp. VCB2006]